MEESEAKLQPGVAFRLQPDGSWKAEKIPPEALKSAKFSGYLTIQGYRCTVFDTPDKNQWAQKSTGTSAEPTTASKLAARWRRINATTITPDQLKKSLVAQLFAFDDQVLDFVNCTSPAIRQTVVKARQALKNHGITNVLDLTGDPSLPKSANEKNVKLTVDLQYTVNGKSVMIEGDREAGLDTYWRDIYGDVAHAIGSMHSKGVTESDPGLPSDPEETLYWDGKTFNSEEPAPTTASKFTSDWLKSHGARPVAVQPMRSLVTSRVAARIAKRYIYTLELEALNVEEHPPDKYLGPSKYLIRVGKNAYVLVPFTEHVVEDLKKLKSTDVMNEIQALEAIQGAMGGMDISAWLDGEGEDPKWIEGNDVDEAFLRSMGIYNPKALKPKAASVASRIATRWLEAQGDITSLVQKTLDRDGDDKEYDKAIVDFVTKTRGKLPPIDAALEKACDLMVKTRDKIEHRHPKVQDRYVQLFLQELAQKQRELEDMRKQLMRGLTVELDRYESEANPIVDG
jgi:hypothetical protein